MRRRAILRARGVAIRLDPSAPTWRNPYGSTSPPFAGPRRPRRDPFRSEQGTVYQPGISAQTVGASSLFLGRVTLPPLERTRAHVHEHHESAFFVLGGSDIELWSGERLEVCARARQGDYLFIPRNVPHVAVNRSATEAAIFIGVRDDPTAQESVAMRPELDACVP